MREKTNCPNCGAPITSTVCPFCGTVFYDFTMLELGEPSYVRVKVGEKIIDCHVMITEMNMTMNYDSAAEMDIRFIILPDDCGVEFMKQER